MGTDGVIVSSFKSLGDGTWEGIFSNIFWDREKSPQAPQGERFVYDGLKEFAEWANSDPENNMPVLEFWHMDTLVLGETTDVEVIGPYIYAKGLWGTDEVSQKFKAYFDSPEAAEEDWRMSHGFRYYVKDWVDGEIQRFRTREVTVIPGKWAANLGTKFMEDANMSLKDDLIKALTGVLGSSDDAEKALAAEEAAGKKAIPEGQVEGRKDADVAPEAPAPVAAVEEQEVTNADLVLALADLLIEREEDKAKIATLEASVEELKGLANTSAEAIKALQSEGEARKQLLPKAVAQAIETRAKSVRDSVPDADVKADVKAVEDALEVKSKKDWKEDPMGAFIEAAGIPDRV